MGQNKAVKKILFFKQRKIRYIFTWYPSFFQKMKVFYPKNVSNRSFSIFQPK